MTPRVTCAWVLLAGLLSTPVLAESLGERAAQERARKKKDSPRSAPVYTDDDLKNGRPTPRPDGEAVPTATPAPGSAVGEGGPDDTASAALAAREEQRRSWQERAKNVAEQLARARAALAEVQARLDRLKSPFHPTAPYGLGNPEVATTEEELAAAKERLAEAEKSKVDFDRDAAQSRVPSRWIQEP